MITHTKKSCKLKLNMTGDIIKFLQAHLDYSMFS